MWWWWMCCKPHKLSRWVCVWHKLCNLGQLCVDWFFHYFNFFLPAASDVVGSNDTIGIGMLDVRRVGTTSRQFTRGRNILYTCLYWFMGESTKVAERANFGAQESIFCKVRTMLSSEICPSLWLMLWSQNSNQIPRQTFLALLENLWYVGVTYIHVSYKMYAYTCIYTYPYIYQINAYIYIST